MDNWTTFDEDVRETAHPVALELLKEDFWWSCIDELTPLGNDIGADTFSFYRKWRMDEPFISATYFLHNYFARMDVPLQHFRLLDPEVIEKKLREKNGKVFLRRMHNRDLIMIATAFTQLIEEGSVEPSILEFAIIAIERQGLPIVLNASGFANEPSEHDEYKHWLERLDKMRAVLTAAPAR